MIDNEMNELRTLWLSMSNIAEECCGYIIDDHDRDSYAEDIEYLNEKFLNFLSKTS